MTGSETSRVIAAGLLLVVWIGVVVLVGMAARRKHRSLWSFFFIALLISPVVAGAIVAAVAPPPELLIEKGLRRECPQCAEAIQLRASICPYCRISVGPPIYRRT